ncbi:MAG: OPT family oligopeptide transporter [Polyangiales bacterium]
MKPARFASCFRATMSSGLDPLRAEDPLEAPANEKRVDAGGTSAPELEKPAPTGDAALAIELKWLDEVYQGDSVKQATARAILMGAVLGGALSLQNLYVGLKTGWGLGVAITACILSYTIYAGLVRLAPKVFGPPMTILENNCMQSTASSAGYSTGGVMTSAIAAYLLVTGKHVGWIALTFWTFFMAVLGTVMAIPMKRQMINIEQLKFPSGMAAAETLKSLHAEGDEAAKKARALGWAAAIGALIAWFRDAHASAKAGGVIHAMTKLSKLPGMIEIPAKFWNPVEWWRAIVAGSKGTPYAGGLLIAGKPAIGWTIGLEGSLIMIAAGALMGLRVTISMLIGAIGNYAVLAPWVMAKGGITKLGYRGIVSWSLWPGAAIMVTSGLLTFALQWRTVVRAFKGLGAVFSAKKKRDDEGEDAYRTGKKRDPLAEAEARLEAVEVPPSWFLGGMAFGTLGIVLTGWIAFGISPLLGVVAVLLSFVLSIVACRATGETDTTPVGAMGKITQLTYGFLAPGNVVTNLMTASITAGAAGSSADLLTDLKSGYLLGANPRKQFLAQLAGTFVGTAVVVPMFYVLVPTPDVLGSDKFPAPSAQVWKGVADLLSKGWHQLHPTAQWGMLAGGVVGIIIPLLEMAFPKKKNWIPSATGLGLALVIPASHAISMSIGALLAYLWFKKHEQQAENYTVAVSSGIIAGESLMGVVILLLGSVLGYLE